MMKQLWAWLDERTGLGRFTEAFLFQNLPGGSRWRYSWGAVVLYTFLLQAITGFFLWTAYSPSTQTAWESIHYVQHEMTGGWVLRGLHHFGAQAFVVAFTDSRVTGTGTNLGLNPGFSIIAATDSAANITNERKKGCDQSTVVADCNRNDGKAGDNEIENHTFIPRYFSTKVVRSLYFVTGPT